MTSYHLLIANSVKPSRPTDPVAPATCIDTIVAMGGDAKEACAIETAFVEGRNRILVVDWRTYPSSKIKHGFNDFQMKPFEQPLSLIMAAVHKSGKASGQKLGEEVLDAIDLKYRGALRKLCERRELLYATWRSETIIKMRVMMSHVAEKRRQWARAQATGSSPRTGTRPSASQARSANLKLLDWGRAPYVFNGLKYIGLVSLDATAGRPISGYLTWVVRVMLCMGVCILT